MSWRHRLVTGTKDVLKIGFGKHLLVTNTLTCGALLATGDFLQQKIEKAQGQNQGLDKTRCGRMFAVGLSQGPPHHYWYVWLDRLIPRKDIRGVLLKILLDQILAAPFFAITFFFGMGVLEDKRMSECWREFVAKFPFVYLFDWCIWPPSQYINFMWVPQAYRVLYVNVVTVIWDIFLSKIKHYDQLEDSSSSYETNDAKD